MTAGIRCGRYLAAVVAAAALVASSGCTATVERTLVETEQRATVEPVAPPATAEVASEPPPTEIPAAPTDAAEPEPTDVPVSESAFTFGDDEALDALWEACAAEDWYACDELFLESPYNSDYESFGLTCGNRADPADFCVAWADPGGGESDTAREDAVASMVQIYRFSPGEAECVADLIFEATGRYDPNEVASSSGLGSVDYLAAAEAIEEGGCVAAVPGPQPGSGAPGNDAAMDELWELCNAEDWVACDDLYAESPIGSVYETFGISCGGRVTTFRYCTEWAG